MAAAPWHAGHRLAGLAKNRPEFSARVPDGVMTELSKLYVDVVGIAAPGALKAVLEMVPLSKCCSAATIRSGPRT